MISPDGLLQNQQYVHGVKYDVTMAPHIVVPIILYLIRHQGTIYTSEAIQRFSWWPKLCHDIKNIYTGATFMPLIYLIWPNTQNNT